MYISAAANSAKNGMFVVCDSRFVITTTLGIPVAAGACVVMKSALVYKFSIGMFNK